MVAVPGISVLPWKSRIDDRAFAATGSVKTASMFLVRGTPVFPRPGKVRTILRGRRLGTKLLTVASVIPFVVLTAIDTRSPAIAGKGTGSMPPSTIVVVTVAPER